MLSSKLDRSSLVICSWDAADNWTDFPRTFQLGSVCDIISRDESMYKKSILGADWVDSLCSEKDQFAKCPDAFAACSAQAYHQMIHAVVAALQ